MSARQKYPGFHPPRFDGIFRPQTTNTSMIFNSSVYPTGVRTKTLQNIQSSKQATCMFDFSKKDKTENKCAPSQEIKQSCTPGISPRGFRETPRSGLSYSESGCWIKTEEKHNLPDVRDHMYINTFFPDERPMRYRELTLPLIKQDRPWSVSEGNPSKRFSAHDVHQSLVLENHVRPKPRIGWMVSSKKDSTDIDLLSVSFDVKQIPNPNKDREIKDNPKQNTSGVRSVYNSPNYPKRPVASEPGRYRPFSTVNIHKSRQITAQISNSPKHFVSVDQYMKYVEEKLYGERVKLPNAPVEFCPRTGPNTSLSQYHDPTIRALQSVIHVNMPSSKGVNSSSGSSSSLTSTGSR